MITSQICGASIEVEARNYDYLLQISHYIRFAESGIWNLSFNLWTGKMASGHHFHHYHHDGASSCLLGFPILVFLPPEASQLPLSPAEDNLTQAVMGHPAAYLTPSQTPTFFTQSSMLIWKLSKVMTICVTCVFVSLATGFVVEVYMQPV